MTPTPIDPIVIGQLEIRYLLDGSATGGLGVFELIVPHGANVPPAHAHAHNEECVYILEGTLRYRVDDESRDLTVGQSMSTPRGSVHAFSNPHPVTAKALVMLSPDIGAQYFRDVKNALGGGGPPDRAVVAAIMGRYGLTVSAPGAAPRPT